MQNKENQTTKKRLSTDEQIQQVKSKIEQLKHKQQALEKKEKEVKRKARTRRLIEYGALAEKYLNCHNIEPKEFEILLNEIVHIENVIKLLPNPQP